MSLLTKQWSGNLSGLTADHCEKKELQQKPRGCRVSNQAVLVIDDDKITRDSLQMFLEFEGLVVSSCESGAAALDLISKKRFEVLLIDYRMPEMNGEELTRRLRPLCPDAFILGFSIESKDQAFLKSGADAFLNKHQLVKKLIPLIKKRMQI
jgi:CheY-like chemotaxis protein